MNNGCKGAIEQLHALQRGTQTSHHFNKINPLTKHKKSWPLVLVFKFQFQVIVNYQLTLL